MIGPLNVALGTRTISTANSKFSVRVGSLPTELGRSPNCWHSSDVDSISKSNLLCSTNVGVTIAFSVKFDGCVDWRDSGVHWNSNILVWVGVQAMKLTTLGSAALVALASLGAAQAQDMNSTAYKPWEGFFAGLNIGGAWNHTCSSWTPGPTITGNPALASAFYNRNCPNNGNFIGGVDLGYNFQIDQWVWGFKADYDAVGSKSNNALVHLYGESEHRRRRYPERHLYRIRQGQPERHRPLGSAGRLRGRSVAAVFSGRWGLCGRATYGDAQFRSGRRRQSACFSR